ncbi:MAG: Crp/Fnr family transcriptional regulator [Spirochaetia bacterium]|nr:Crp/Fnr family transcriptional regulator [Spirochaetia bacterium]
MMAKKDLTDFLKQTGLFSGVSPRGLTMIGEQARENRFRKGDIIFNEGESGDSLHIVYRGMVKITKYNKDGKAKTLAVLKEKDSFGEMAVLTEETRSATVEALDDIITYSVTKDEFESLIKKEPSISLQIIRTLSQRLAKADRDIKMTALGDARARVAYVLMDLKGELEGSKFTHQEIADLAGLTRETTTRTLSRLEAEGYINVKQKKFAINNPQKMKELFS